MSKGDKYDLFPKIPIHTYGAVLRSKKVLFCTPDAELDLPVAEGEEELVNVHPGGGLSGMLLAPPPEHLVIEPSTVLFYIEDAQFMAASKTQAKSMSAWIRFHFVTGDKRSLWYTVLCSPKRIWDFETYRKKKKIIRGLFDEAFEVVELGK